MSYRNETIAAAISQINRQYFLPAIQREFVWKPEQVVRLFDSVLRGYPISSFLFWEVFPENREKWQIYRFIDQAHQGGSHNHLTNADGVQNLFLVLDGQQRLTSLFLGLQGSFRLRKKYQRRKVADSWSTQRLHLNLLAERKDLEDSGDSTGLYYHFAFRDSEECSNNEERWFRVGRILDYGDRSVFDSFLDELDNGLERAEVSRIDRKSVDRNLTQLYRAIHVDEPIAYHTERDQDFDRVLDIFVRANDGGTKLSKSDLLLSMVTSNWGGTNAREEIFQFVESLNANGVNTFNKDFIMKSCLVLSGLPIAYKVGNFTSENPQLIYRNWPTIRAAIKDGVDLVNSFGINGENLTSVNAVIPVLYYLSRLNGVALRGSTPFETRNAALVWRWLITALLKGAFGRASDALLTDIRTAIDDAIGLGSDFPTKAIDEIFARTGLNLGIDESILDLRYQGQQTFLALSLLYDQSHWGSDVHQDHLFARGLYGADGILGISRREWIEKSDRLGNLCLILAKENIGKQALPLTPWIGSRDSDFRRRHLIPEDSELWHVDRFDDFMRERGKTYP